MAELSSKDILTVIVGSFIILPIISPFLIGIFHRFEDKVHKSEGMPPRDLGPNQSVLPYTIIIATIFSVVHSLYFYGEPSFFLVLVLSWVGMILFLRLPAKLFNIALFIFVAANIVNLGLYLDVGYQPYIPMYLCFLDLFSAGLFVTHNKCYNAFYKWRKSYSLTYLEARKLISSQDELCFQIWQENLQIYESPEPEKIYYEYPELFDAFQPYNKSLEGGIWAGQSYRSKEDLSDQIRKSLAEIDRRTILIRRDTYYFMIIYGAMMVLVFAISTYFGRKTGVS